MSRAWVPAVLLAIAVSTLAAVPPAAAQDPLPTPSPQNPFSDLADQPRPRSLQRAMLVILDASGSMRADDGSGSTKIATAKRVLNEVLDDVPPNLGLGLRVYGHRVPNRDREGGCRDTELLRPVSAEDLDSLRPIIDGITATGWTPISESLRLAASEVPQVRDRSMVLVSDGINTCGPPPCSVAREIAARDEDLRINTIGFQVNADARRELQCVAEVTGGRYYDADDEKDLFAAFRAYELLGEEIRGGDVASSALPLVSGQYVDTLRSGQERWYVVDVAEGQTLRGSATLVGAEDGRRAPDGRFAMELSTPDVLGSLHCAKDSTGEVGFGLTHVGISWADAVAEDRLCSSAGERYLRLSLVEDSGDAVSVVRPDNLDGQEFAVELVVAIEPPGGAGAASAGSGAAPVTPVREPRPRPVQGGSGTAVSLLALLTGLGLGALSAGRAVSRSVA